MYRKFFIVPLLIIAASCGRAKKVELTGDSTQMPAIKASADKDSIARSKNKAVAASLLIVPGKSIGNTKLNGNLDSLMAVLGKPDASDAAMGASFHTWYANHKKGGYQTDIYAHHNYDGKHDDISYIKAIRVTSPAFKTEGNIYTTLALTEINKQFKLSHIATYFKGTDSLKVYDDKAKGISFEVNNAGKCSGIIVHAAGDESIAYISMHPDMQRADVKK